MDQDHRKCQRLREGGLAFFGTISASLSHEINNVLAIVSELSGLLADLTAGAMHSRPLDPDRMSRMSSRIDDQVERGKRLVKRLNRFAHTVDQPVGRMEVNEILELITTLCRRFADLEPAILETGFPEQPVVIESSAFELMQAVHLCIDLTLAAEEGKQQTVTVGFRDLDQGCSIEIVGSEPPLMDRRAEERLSYLELLMKELGGRASCSRDTDALRFELYIPRKHSGPTPV